MGAIGGLLGLGGGASGSGFDKPQLANLETQQGMPLGLAAGESYYQNQGALAQQQRLVDALTAQGGLQKQGDVFNQLQNVASGQGPNPAQAMLNQRTAENVANQAALAAGVRGSGANAGLVARQAAQAGAGAQQQAVGQGATMQANQSLGALNQMGGMANTMAGNQVGAQNAFTGAMQNQQANLLNALAAQNQARVSNQASVNAGNAALAGQNMQGQQGLLGGLGNALGAGLGTLVGGAGGNAAAKAAAKTFGAAHGGAIGGPQSSFGQHLAGMNSGGMVDVMLSPGEKVVPPEKVNEAAGGSVDAMTVPGEAKVSGDSTKNDTVKTKLPEGSIVVPRTKSKSTKESADFVRRVLARRGGKK